MNDLQLMEVCFDLHAKGAWPGSCEALLERMLEEIDELVGHPVFTEADYLELATSAIIDERSREAAWN